MRILIVTDQYAPLVGGVPAVTGALARGLAERGHAVTVLAPADGPRASAGADGLAQVRYAGSVPWPWYPGLRMAKLPARAVGALVAAALPDVVHTHSPLVLGVLARRRAAAAGVPVVYTNHYLPANVSTGRGWHSGLLEAGFYGWVLGFANRCGYVTAPTATALALLNARGLRVPSAVISNGIDTARFAPGPADGELRRRYGLRAGRPVVLSVGRLSGEKRVDVLLAAAAQLTRPAQLVVAGTGPLDAALRAEAARLGLAGRVRFVGHVPDADLPGLYRLADVFAIASEAELQSLVTMEAMATGLPVVAADAHALGELVGHGSNGFLFPAADAARLASHLDLLIADPGLRKRMGWQSLRLIGDHRQAGRLAEWESLYGQLAVTRARHPARAQ